MLEDHPDLGALACDFGLAQLVQPISHLPVAHQLAVDREAPGVDFLEVVDATQERRLARAGRSEQAHHLAGRHRERYPLQHLQTPEALAHRLGVDHRDAHDHSCLGENTAARQRPSAVDEIPRVAPRA